MRTATLTTSLVILIFLSLTANAATDFRYTDPVPGAKYVSAQNGIIIGLGKVIDIEKTNTSRVIRVYGEKSGLHLGETKIVENNTKLLFRPLVPFQFGEVVHITVSGIRTVNGSAIKEYSFSFTTQSCKVQLSSSGSAQEEINPSNKRINDPIQPFSTGFPVITVQVDRNPTPGLIFMSDMGFDEFSYTPYLIILENSGVPYYYKQLPIYSCDFKKQPNGFLTYYGAYQYTFYEMNTVYAIVDSFYCKNGYHADEHELRVLDDGSSYMLSYDPEIVDMSQIISGGNPNATVVGLVIQKLDANKSVVFQWRSWDHFNILDVLHQNLYASNIDYVHGNAIEVEDDGNILLSSRHLCEITKINTSNGSMIWRWGGVHNQFTFLNDTIGFSYQHAIRRLPNGNLIMFDNGNYHRPVFSRAVEYSMDTANKTVTQVWQYRHTPDIQSSAMGYAQRLSNGNTLISWGAANPTLTEVTSAGETELELSLPNVIYSYRTTKSDWNGDPLEISHQTGTVPRSYALKQNFPNPFNPTTVIKFDITKSSKVNLVVFNELGQEISKLVNENLPPGDYSVTFDGTQLPSGVYFYRLNAGDFTSIKKMVLIK